MSKTVLFQVIQFSISTHFSSIWPIDKTLSDATTLGQSGLGSNGNEGVLYIPQSSSITWTSPSDCLVSYPGPSLRRSYPSAEMQSVYSTAPADWAMFTKRSPECQMITKYFCWIPSLTEISGNEQVDKTVRSALSMAPKKD